MFTRVISFAIVIAVSACNGQSSNAASGQVLQDIQYGSAGGERLLLDVYEPPAQSGQIHPAVVLIHGGGWTSFDKSTMRTMGQFLSREGFVAFAVDYRLFDGKKNRWPDQLDDVELAVRWIRANAAKYNVNPDRIGAFGHSAGAQLAALLGVHHDVQAVVDVSGPSDLCSSRDNPDDAHFLANFLGGSVDQKQACLTASPAGLVAAGDPPFLIVHGTRDPQVPIAQSQERYDKLKADSVPVSFIKVDDVHTFQTPDARRTLAIQTLAFFNRYLSAPQ